MSFLIDRLALHLHRFHWHRWTESAWNGYGVAVEERCRCGARRHHFIEDVGRDYTINWREGPHPVAAAKRAAQVRWEG